MNDEVVSKEQCSDCASEGLDSAGDNLVTFQSGVKYCVARHGTKGVDKTTTSVAKVDNIQKATTDLFDGEYPKNSIRGISPKTFEFYGYQINRQKKCHIANYYNDAGQVVMQQLRDASKQFPLRGDISYNKTLYGSWLFTPDERVFITITEGQLDCLSVAEVFDCKYPVVSLPNGCQSAYKVLQSNMKYLSGFKYIVLAFDSDGPGQDAINQCLKLFEPGKLRITKWVRKDANDHLKEKEHSIIRNLVYNAVEYLPDPILTGEAWLDTMRSFERKTRPWPWAAANNALSPIFIPSIYTIAAWPGVGKTVVVADIMRHAIKLTGKVGVISLEESSQVLLCKLTDMLTGSDLQSVSNRKFTDKEIELCRAATENVVTYDHKTYGSGLETILENLPYIAQSLNCEIIIFDNLSYSATGEGDDERRGIDKAMIKLKDSSTKYGYTLFNVCHLNEDNEDFKKTKVRGSRGVDMYSDQVIYLGRNCEEEDLISRNTLQFYVKKDRATGRDTGKGFELYYNPVTRKFKGLVP